MDKSVKAFQYGDFQEEFIIDTGHQWLEDPELYAQYITIKLLQENNVLMSEILKSIKEMPKEIATQISRTL